MVALSQLAAQTLEKAKLIGVLDPFRRDARVEGPGERHGGVHDGGVFGIGAQPVPVGAVCIERVYGGALSNEPSSRRNRGCALFRDPAETVRPR